MDEMHVLQKLLMEAGYPVRSYSGRGMFGKHCLGVDTHKTVARLVADVFVGGLPKLLEAGPADDFSELSEAFASMKTDQMGKGNIIYFESVPFVDEQSEDEDIE